MINFKESHQNNPTDFDPKKDIVAFFTDAVKDWLLYKKQPHVPPTVAVIDRNDKLVFLPVEPFFMADTREEKELANSALKKFLNMIVKVSDAKHLVMIFECFFLKVEHKTDGKSDEEKSKMRAEKEAEILARLQKKSISEMFEKKEAIILVVQSKGGKEKFNLLEIVRDKDDKIVDLFLDEKACGEAQSFGGAFSGILK